MKKTKKLFIFLVCLTASLFAFAACGGDGNSSQSDGASASAEMKYTVTFETNGGSDTASLSLFPGDAVTRPADPVREHYTFSCWCKDAALTEEYTFGTMPEENLVIYAKWIPDRAVRISFDSNGGSAVSEMVAGVGEALTAPEAPTKTGYTFDGWYTDAELTTAFDFAAAPESNTTLYAKWARAEGYSFVNYYLNGRPAASVPVVNGERAEALAPEGLETDGKWYTDEEFTVPYDFSSPVTADVSLYNAGYTAGLKIENGAVVGYTGASEEVIVPVVYGGEKVTAIADSAFFGNKTILSVLLPETVTSVGAYAFYGCAYLETINLSASVKTIGKYAFYGNERLESFGDLSGISAVEEGTFLGCEKITSAELPEGTSYIGAYAFAECVSLGEIGFPESLTSVGDYAFQGCSSLTKVRIPGALTTIGTGAFSECDSLDFAEVAEGNATYSVVNGNLYTDAGKTLVLYFRADKQETAYTTGGETTILEGAFANGDSLTSIVIGEGVTKIERGALKGVSNLQSLTVPYLGDGAGNQFLAYIFGAERAADNGTTGLYVPKTLQSLTITSPVGAVAGYAFYGCTGLREISGLDGASSYGAYAFAYSGLESAEVPATVTEIGENAFSGCASLTEIKVAADNANYASYDGCLYDAALKVLYTVPSAKTSVEFPDSVKEISSYAFRDSLVESVEIPESVETIGANAFCGCNALRHLRVPFIGGSRTENTYMLYIFGGHYTVETDEEGEESVTFDNTGAYPALLESIDYYGTADIPDYAFTYCSTLKSVNYGDEITRIGKYAFSNTALSSLAIGSGVTSIGDFAYSYLDELEGEITIPGTVREMGEGVLAGSRYVTAVTFEEGVTEIGRAFMLAYTSSDSSTETYYYYSSLEEINIPASVTKIHPLAFTYAGYNYDSSQKKQVTSPVRLNIAEGSKLTLIDEAAFAYSGIVELNLPASVQEIGVQAFFGCEYLTAVNFGTAEEGSALSSIGGLAFGYCPALAEMNIYKTVTSTSDVPAISPYTAGGGAINFLYGSSVPAINVRNASLYKSQRYWSEYAKSIYEME